MNAYPDPYTEEPLVMSEPTAGVFYAHNIRRTASFICFVAAFLLLLMLFIPGLCYVMLALFVNQPSPILNEWISVITIYGISIPLCYLMIRSLPKSRPQGEKKSFGFLLLVFFVACFLLRLGSNIGVLVNDVIEMLSGIATVDPINDPDAQSFIGLRILTMTVIAPIAEELFFRRALLDRLGIYGAAPAAALSALLFGFYHGNLYQFFYALFIGLLFGAIYMKTGRVRYTILLHVALNLVFGALPILLQTLEPTGGAFSVFFTFFDVSAFLFGFVWLLILRRRLSLKNTFPVCESENTAKFFNQPGFYVFMLVSLVLFLLAVLL